MTALVPDGQFVGATRQVRVVAGITFEALRKHARDLHWQVVNWLHHAALALLATGSPVAAEDSTRKWEIGSGQIRAGCPVADSFLARARRWRCHSCEKPVASIGLRQTKLRIDQGTKLDYGDALRDPWHWEWCAEHGFARSARDAPCSSRDAPRFPHVLARSESVTAVPHVGTQSPTLVTRVSPLVARGPTTRRPGPRTNRLVRSYDTVVRRCGIRSTSIDERVRSQEKRRRGLGHAFRRLRDSSRRFASMLRSDRNAVRGHGHGFRRDRHACRSPRTVNHRQSRPRRWPGGRFAGQFDGAR